MGGIPVNVIASDVSSEWLDNAIQQTRSQVSRWEAELSLYQPDSAVNKIRLAHTEPVCFSDHGWEAIHLAHDLEIATEGAFDVTVGSLIRVWKNAEKHDTLPDQKAINTALAVTGFEHLILLPDIQGVQLASDFPVPTDPSVPEIRLDVGGFAKGLFAQWINEFLRRYDDGSGNRPDKLIVDLGGDMFVSTGKKHTRCTVGIRDPFSDDPSKLWGVINCSRGAVVTSGTYERHFLIHGKRYCHIVDPGTGFPIETDLVSVTIIDPEGGMADALATALFVMGEEKGCQLVDSRKNTEVVIIRKDGSYFVSEGLKGDLQIL